jgi:adenylate kinase
MRLILLGPPGSGKGSQAKFLCQWLGLKHIATGDILREAVRLGTPLGMQAKSFMEQGKYVPDELVNAIVAECFRGAQRPERFVMDGYPRTLAQAISFDQIWRQGSERSRETAGLDGVIWLQVSDDEIVRRATGRRICPRDGSLYHLQHKPPRQAGICDRCGTPLEQRPDDQEATVRERLRVFHATVPAVVDYYRRQGLLREVNGEGSIQSVQTMILRALGVEEGTC